MAEPVPDEDYLLALLNSTPVVDGVPTDDLADPARARAWLASAGGVGTDEELRDVLQVRSALSWPGTPWPSRAPDGCVRAPTTNAACSSSTGPGTTPPGGARWPCAATA